MEILVLTDAESRERSRDYLRHQLLLFQYLSKHHSWRR